MPSVVRVAWLLFVLLAAVVGYNIWSADNGVSNALLDWVSHVRHGDKYAHFFLYGGLAGLLHVALRGKAWRIAGLALPVGALLVLAFGLAEEITQLFSPRRQFSGMDLAANLAGVLVFTLLAQGVLARLRTSRA